MTNLPAAVPEFAALSHSATLSAADLLLWSALPDLTLNIAQTASLCGVSVRQLGYWTKQGYIAATGRGARRLYGPEALRRILAIRQTMHNGLSLRQSLRALEGPAGAVLALDHTAQGKDDVPAAPAAVLSPDAVEAVAGDLMLLFERNRVIRDSVPGLAVKLGRSVDDVQNIVERLAARGTLNKTHIADEIVYTHAEGMTL